MFRNGQKLSGIMSDVPFGVKSSKIIVDILERYSNLTVENLVFYVHIYTYKI